MSHDDDERISYLEGAPAESLSARERAQLDELRAILGSSATWEEPDPALEEQIVAAISQEARARPVAPSRQPKRRWPRLTLRRPVYAIGAFAAAAAAVVAIVVVAGRNTSPAPQHFAMVVYGTPLAPSASGTASLTKTESGWEINLSATGLPRLDGSRFYYQAWLKDVTGILVPVGTFNDAKHVTLWSGVPVTKYRTLTVTEQPANGNPASSGRRVLVGTIR